MHEVFNRGTILQILSHALNVCEEITCCH